VSVSDSAITITTTAAVISGSWRANGQRAHGHRTRGEDFTLSFLAWEKEKPKVKK
jgi:hypothetical protein